MSPKNFPAWHAKKALIDSSKPPRYFYEREIWWMHLGHNVGTEEDGKGIDFTRPVLILRKFSLNSFLGVVLTSKVKNGPYYYPFPFAGATSTALLSHVRDYDSKRLITKMGTLDKTNYQAMQTKLAAIITKPAV